MQQSKSETIVVCSNHPDGAADWVEKNYPAAKIVMLDDENEFNMSKNRNAGLNLATTKWICFIDADIIIQSDFTDRVLPLLRDGNYYTFSQPGGLSGTCIAALNDLVSVGGYDEALVGWGGEDTDLHARLRLHKISSGTIPLELIESSIKHSQDTRTKYYHQKDIFVSHAIAELYAEIKFSAMIATQNFNVSINERKRMFNFASDFINSHIRSGTASGSFNFRIPLHNAVPFLSLKVEKEITIKVNLQMLTSRQIALLTRATEAYNGGKFSEAKLLCREIIKAKPDFFKALHLLAMVQTRLGRLNDALASYERALAIRPMDAEALNNSGLVLQKMKRFDEALASYDRALAFQPDLAQALRNRGNLLFFEQKEPPFF